MGKTLLGISISLGSLLGITLIILVSIAAIAGIRKFKGEMTNPCIY